MVSLLGLLDFFGGGLSHILFVICANGKHIAFGDCVYLFYGDIYVSKTKEQVVSVYKG